MQIYYLYYILVTLILITLSPMEMYLNLRWWQTSQGAMLVHFREIMFPVMKSNLVLNVDVPYLIPLAECTLVELKVPLLQLLVPRQYGKPLLLWFNYLLWSKSTISIILNCIDFPYPFTHGAVFTLYVMADLPGWYSSSSWWLSGDIFFMRRNIVFFQRVNFGEYLDIQQIISTSFVSYSQLETLSFFSILGA